LCQVGGVFAMTVLRLLRGMWTGVFYASRGRKAIRKVSLGRTGGGKCFAASRHGKSDAPAG